MTDYVLTTLRLPVETAAKLADVAKTLDVSESYVATEAIETWIGGREATERRRAEDLAGVEDRAAYARYRSWCQARPASTI